MPDGSPISRDGMSAGADREATLALIAAYCARRGFAVPAITETENGGTISLHGTAPDASQFYFGLEPDPRA